MILLPILCVKKACSNILSKTLEINIQNIVSPYNTYGKSENSFVRKISSLDFCCKKNEKKILFFLLKLQDHKNVKRMFFSDIETIENLSIFAGFGIEQLSL